MKLIFSLPFYFTTFLPFFFFFFFFLYIFPPYFIAHVILSLLPQMNTTNLYNFFSSQPLWLFFFSSFYQKVYLNFMACINVPILYFLPLEPLYRYVIIRVYFHCYFNILSKAECLELKLFIYLFFIYLFIIFFFHASHASHYSFIQCV